MTAVLVVLGCAAVAGALTGGTLRVARHRGILDVPSERSSHDVPTPRGGGLGVVVVVAGALAVLLVVTPAERALWLALLVGGIAVAAVGGIDDVRTVSASVRIAVHGAAAAWALWLIGGLPIIDLGATTLLLGTAGSVLGWLGIVWLTNLYNFMDGIDGIAGVEAVTVGLALGTFLTLGGHRPLAAVCWALAGGAAGFLVWNWPPAKIFMGDVGSGFVGFTFGVVAVAAQNRGVVSLLIPLLLLGVFLVDATATLLRRAAGRERWFDAHRSHAYQRGVQRGLGHGQVTIAVGGLNIILIVAAAVAWMMPALTAATFVGAIVALLAVWWRTIRSTAALGAEREAG